MVQISCPHCGAQISSNRTICPNCHAKLQDSGMLKVYAIAGGIVVLAALVGVIFLMGTTNPGSSTVSSPAPPALGAGGSSNAPSCSITVTATKSPPKTIRITVSTSTCTKSEISALRVSLNGAEVGRLSPSVGSFATYTGVTGPNNVIVVAESTNGADRVILQNAAL